MYLWTASTRKVATAALAIPDMAAEPLGAFILKSEKAASVNNSNPNPVIIVINLRSSCFLLSADMLGRFPPQTAVTAVIALKLRYILGRVFAMQVTKKSPKLQKTETDINVA